MRSVLPFSEVGDFERVIYPSRYKRKEIRVKWDVIVFETMAVALGVELTRWMSLKWRFNCEKSRHHFGKSVKTKTKGPTTAGMVINTDLLLMTQRPLDSRFVTHAMVRDRAAKSTLIGQPKFFQAWYRKVSVQKHGPPCWCWINLCPQGGIFNWCFV